MGPTRPRDVVIPTGKAANDLYEQLIEEGNIARDEREYTNAETAYRHAQSIKPKDSRGTYGLGNLYGDQMRWEEAEEAYRKALEIEPDDATAYIALSFVLTQPVSAPNLADRYEEAEKLARRSIRLAPSNSLAFDQLGVSLELRGLIGTETENAYRTSIKLDPGFALAHAHLGRLLRRRGRAAEADDAYQNAVRRATDVPTMILVADVMQSEQRYAESELLLRRALAVDTKNPAGLLMLGRALTALGSFAEAENVLKKSLTVSSNGFESDSLLGSLYARQGKFEYAENALLQAMRFVSPNGRLSLSLQFETVGDGYLKDGKARSAERAYRQAISLDGERESLLGKLARAQHS
jgi:Flp pilus assembly protein TadD